jgi:hypothetical protein
LIKKDKIRERPDDNTAALMDKKEEGEEEDH